MRESFKTRLMEKITTNTKLLTIEDKSELIRNICLAVIDEEYRNHLSSMEYLRQSIGLRGYAQKNPKNEYKKESFELFNLMLTDISKEILKISCRIKIENYNPPKSSNKIKEKLSTETDFSDMNISRNALCLAQVKSTKDAVVN